MNKSDAEVIVAEARALGIAFVEDEYNEDDVYNPNVDRGNAEAWLLDKLVQL